MTPIWLDYVEGVHSHFPPGKIKDRFAVHPILFDAVIQIDPDREYEFANYVLYDGKWMVMTHKEDSLLNGFITDYSREYVCDQMSVEKDSKTIYNDYVNNQLPRLRELREKLSSLREQGLLKEPEGWLSDEELRRIDTRKQGSSVLFYLLVAAGFIGFLSFMFGGFSGEAQISPPQDNNLPDSSVESPIAPPTISSDFSGGGSGSFVICEDGTTSSAGGQQGACSWHGGVSP